jgi:hypothetical protein
MATVANYDRVISKLSLPPRFYFQSADGVQKPVGSRGRRYWVVSRRLCNFFAMPLKKVGTAAAARDEIALQIERMSTAAETGSHVHYGADVACIWLWDQEAVARAAAAIGVNVARMTVVPETALLPPAARRVRLLKLGDGYEGQRWGADGLEASRWWPAPPDDRGWVMFQRGAGVPPDRLQVKVPSPVSPDWLNRPWTRTRSDRNFSLREIDAGIAAMAMAVLFLAAFTYLGAQWLHLSASAADIDAETAHQAAKLSHDREARNTALENLSLIRHLQALDQYPGQLDLLARVAEILPHNDAHLTQWDFDRGQLDFTVESGHRLDAAYFVEALQKVERFKQVAAERQGGDNTLHIRLTVAAR